MTDSRAPRASRGDKRDRLVAAAAVLLHRQGAVGTSLADVAAEAGVPLGNVYYWFRTKDDLVRAVVDAQTGQAAAMLAGLEDDPDPAARLAALVGRWDEMRDLVARFGCPFGGLSVELGRRDDGHDTDAARPLAAILDWTAAQFAALGVDEPHARAVTLLAGVQGAALLAAGFGDAELLTAEVARLRRWIADTAAGRGPAASPRS